MFSSFRNYIITFLISLVIFGLIGYFAVRIASESLAIETPDGGVDIPDNVITQAPDETTPVDLGTDFSDIKGESFTMILIGTDYRPAVMNDYKVTTTTGGFPDPKRIIEADAIYVVRFDKEKGECMISAIPSNMEVTVNGVRTMLKEVYADRGLQFLIDKVSGVTGLKFDYYTCVHIQDFIDLVDTLGGFTYEVPTDMYYVDNKEGLVINIKKGYQWLSGAQVAQMLRYRGYSDGNVSRMNNTVNFMKSVLTYLTDPQFLPRAIELYSKVINYTKTNLWIENMTDELDLIYALPRFKIVALTYPGSVDGEYFEPKISDAVEMYFRYRTQF